MNAKELIKTERARQIAVEGWTEAHDDGHAHGELAAAAECYRRNDPARWPWEKKWWKPGTPQDRVRRLTKAGALLRAERARLKRMERMVRHELAEAIRRADSLSRAQERDGHR